MMYDNVTDCLLTGVVARVMLLLRCGAIWAYACCNEGTNTRQILAPKGIVPGRPADQSGPAQLSSTVLHAC